MEVTMIKKLVFFITLSMIFFACGTRTEQPPPAGEEELAVISVATFDSLAGEYIGQEVQIEGLIDHVCRHGGKRMFLVYAGTDGRVKVTTGENIPSFDVALEGSDVVVKGVVDELRIDEQYLTEWENELIEQEALQTEEHAEGEPAGAEEHGHGEHTGMGDQADQGTHTDTRDQIKMYREQIASSDKGYISFYSIICSEYALKEE